MRALIKSLGLFFPVLFTLMFGLLTLYGLDSAGFLPVNPSGAEGFIGLLVGAFWLLVSFYLEYKYHD